MNALGVRDFSLWFEAVHGHGPFPWQVRLVEEVLARGRWPDVLALPTAAGKTSVLDVALFCLAAQPGRFARRIVLVIDRRVVVDQAAARAQRLLEAHTTVAVGAGCSAEASALVERVALALRGLWRGESHEAPFQCATLRGGMPREDAWAGRPDRPVIAVSTVDQVGARLMFRGYGVSSRMSSVHAGLLGEDTLFLLDEVHLAEPFAQTLLALRDRWRPFHPGPVESRWGVVRMSATPGTAAPGERRFGLDDPGWREDREHPVLRQRLLARKKTRLQTVQVAGRQEGDRVASLARAAAESARRQLQAGARRVAVVLNRVQGARAAAAALQEAAAAAGCDVRLLTGRMRPLDRDDALQDLLPRIQASGCLPSTEADRPLVVVATQCIEAGADFDFDALITECASLDALRQRFGRLDRLGRRGHTAAVVLARSDQVAEAADEDPIYGAALAAAWRFLGGEGAEVDFGIDAMDERLRGVDPKPLLPPKQLAPVLLPTHLDLLVQTHPRPSPDPYLPDWLHGPRRGEPEVQVVWRADLRASDLQDEASDLSDALDRLDACPPSSLEALSLPIGAVRRWLSAIPEAVLADVSVQQPEEEVRPDRTATQRPALAWMGDESQRVVPAYIRPGMTLILPCSYGGLRNGNWTPDATEAAADLAERAHWLGRRQALLRLHDDCLPEVLRGPKVPKAQDEEPAVARRRRIADWLREATGQPLAEPWQGLVRALLAQRDRLKIVQHADGGFTLVGPRADSVSVSTEDDGASFVEAPVTLAAHSADVRAWTQRFTRNLGIAGPLADDLALAAWLHDIGKADPRFQCWLVGGSEIRLAMMDEPLAKSAQAVFDRAALRSARARAGYPAGYRHELLSVAMLAANPDMLARAHDADLVLHLIGSHHGWCRPFAPAELDEAPVMAEARLPSGDGAVTTGRDASIRFAASTDHGLARLDSGVADRFWRLNRRYGWWGLAWLEAIVRLADHRASDAHSTLAEGLDDER